MWIMLSDCFFSIVHKDCGQDELLVRARRPGDIEKVFPDALVKETPGNDYRYRAVIKRADVCRAINEKINNLNYPNFKDTCYEDDLHNAYLGVWRNMEKIQPGGAYGLRTRK